MDAKYLQENVNQALTEALTAMAAAQPVDKVDYIARYLIQSANRKVKQGNVRLESAELDKMVRESEYENENERKRVLANDAIEKENINKLDVFISSLTDAENKKDAMDKVTQFLSDYLKIPAVYIAIKKVSGESEYLHYVSANKGQEHVVGSTLNKLVEAEGDDVPVGQGFSFKAFEIPPPEPEEEPVEGEEAPIQKPAPIAVPLIVTNVMSDKRCKFFGIPKLGAFVAVPFFGSTIDHENGCIPSVPSETALPAEGEDAAPTDVAVTRSTNPYSMNKQPLSMIISMDTIGNYRLIKETEISVVQKVGEGLIRCFSILEDALFDSHVKFLTDHKSAADQVATVLVGIIDKEVAAIGEVAALYTIDPTIDPPPEPFPEQLKSQVDSGAVCKVWNAVFADEGIASILMSMSNHLLPMPQSVINLFTAAVYLVDISCSIKQVGDYENIRLNVLPKLGELVRDYDPKSSVSVPRVRTLQAIKAFIETSNALDASSYPSHLTLLPLLSAWMSKAIAARDAYIIYSKEVNNLECESVI